MRERTVPIEFLVIHHSADDDHRVNIDDLVAERKRRGEGYNYIIDDEDFKNDRKVRQQQDVPDAIISNGVYGLNGISLNVCVNGNHETHPPTLDELDALVQWLAIKAKKLGWCKDDVWRIIGHQEAGAKYSATHYGTACPGKFLIMNIPMIRKRVAAYLPLC